MQTKFEQEIESCEKWLRLKLTPGEYYLADDMREDAKLLGYQQSVFKQARKKVGVKTYHQYDLDGPTPNYFWYIPKTVTLQPSSDANTDQGKYSAVGADNKSD